MQSKLDSGSLRTYYPSVCCEQGSANSNDNKGGLTTSRLFFKKVTKWRFTAPRRMVDDHLEEYVQIFGTNLYGKEKYDQTDAKSNLYA